MDKIAATSSLLAKVARGTYIDAGRHSSAAAAGAFPEQASQLSEYSDRPAGAVPNRHNLSASRIQEPGADIPDRPEEAVFFPEDHAVAGKRIAKGKAGDDRLRPAVREEGVQPSRITAKQDPDAAFDLSFSGKKDSGVGVPTPLNRESETSDKATASRKSRSPEARKDGSVENSIRMLPADDFRAGQEKRREKDDALKALFPSAGTDREAAREERTELAERGDDPGALREKEPFALSENKSLRSTPHASHEPLFLPMEASAPLFSKREGEGFIDARNEAAPAGRATLPTAKDRPRIDSLMEPNGLAASRPVLNSEVPALLREAPRQETQAKREGVVKIGKINIVVKGRERTRNEDLWPEAPAYADHLITEDWEWSCRYGR